MVADTSKTASSTEGGTLTLSMHWLDEEGWAGTKGKSYLPGDKVKVDSGQAGLLRMAGYEAREGQ